MANLRKNDAPLSVWMAGVLKSYPQNSIYPQYPQYPQMFVLYKNKKGIIITIIPEFFN
ncbi:hypothetical protein ABEV55_02635 [Aneurinibacillus thermoaerophilus]|uniref:hypothetical protein n=1 Tax=Aneurinibacillus thermoaerophilus TaxID=143495 RepID=UPI002E1CB676|nr:hypothetical protein [Aneurinibacillus thermoaerophilus]